MPVRDNPVVEPATVQALPSGVGSRRVLLVGTGYAVFALLGWSAVVAPSLVRSIERDFAVRDVTIGAMYFLGASFFATSALAGGALVERFGRRVVLSGGAYLAMGGFALAAAAPSWPVFLAGATLANAGMGLIDAQMMGLFLDLYPEAKGTAMSVLNGFLSVGGLLAPLGIGVAVTAGAPWRGVMAATALGFAVVGPALMLQAMPSGRRRHREGHRSWLRRRGHPEGHPEGTRREQTDSGVVGREERSLLPFFCLAVGIALSTSVTYGVTDWVVRFLADVPLDRATLALSAFWAGIAVSRFLANWVVERVEYSTVVMCCVALASLALAGAIVVPSFPVRVVLFGAAGLFYGPGFPLILAMGANLYPHRIPLLSGGLTMAASVGVIVYPPLMGLMANTVGLRVGMLTAACLGAPIAGCVLMTLWWRREPAAGGLSP